ncbi:hypothetical protein CRG98_038313 [Punica granatum]|nr:hypothetical protein CRG98_038313 [Punica granatum]
MAGREAYTSATISPFSSSSSEAIDPIWIPVPSSAFHEPMVNFEKVVPRDGQNGDEEDYEGYGFLQPNAKKRRLSAHQVQFLERSFDVENKLEPERKAQLAKELGLQPRQVAIWFQNRRARFKSKQLEKEYGELKDSYDKLKAECDCLLKEEEQLKEEVLSLKEKLLIKEKGKENQNSSDPLEPVSSGNISEDQKPNIAITKDLPDQKPTWGCKPEEATTSASRSSGVLDSDSPYFTDSNHQALLLEPANSSHAFEPDCSDFSQEEGDNLDFPRLDHGVYRAPPTSTCGFGFTAELDQQFWSWPY